ncbi:MAG: redoxin domain-containing protein [Candidatus Hydrogenedentes bacterium]|nr:redoxin domain-containing protein [Candidatus Hydrogenedentota bacterium]
MTRRLTLATVIALSVLGLGSAMALEIGEVVGPVGFETIDGFKRTMENYGERVGTVLVFLSARSAAVEKVIAEIGEIYEQYRFSEILFVGVVPNSQEQPEELRAFVQNHGLRFPVYRDGEGSVARRFGATVAPEFFLLDREGALVYRGGLPYLEAAIRLMVARKPIEVAASKVDGTPISDVGPAVEIEDPYGDLYFASELIFRKIPGVAVHHCSTVTEAENGDLLCLWYGGSYESAEDQALYLALCPTCAAMYKEFIKRDPDSLKDLKQHIVTVETPEVPLRLGQTTNTIRFVEAHFSDLKTIIGKTG